jgi:hypothetical protein
MKTWPEAMANVDQNGLDQTKGTNVQVRIRRTIEVRSSVDSEFGRRIPTDAPDWSRNADSLRTLVKQAAHGHRWEG